MARIKVKVVPRASKTEIVGWLGDSLKVRVAAPPERGRANAVLEDFLARHFLVRNDCVQVTSGHGSSRKTVTVSGLDAVQIKRLLPPQ